VELLAVALSLLLTLVAVIIGMAKVQHLPASLEMRDRAGIGPTVWTTSGWIELVAAAILVIGVFAAHEAAMAAAMLLAVSYAAYAIRQLTRRLPVAAVTPALALVLLAGGVAAAIAVAR
jgi:uncharacterized membrane protein YphA (DoxX/SURF4 family)